MTTDPLFGRLVLANLKTHYLYAGLSKVAGFRQKSPPTWLVSAGYSALYFFTEGFF